jgi:dephospho-CoA kinase
MKIILGLVGEKLSGKDTVAKYLMDKHGAFHVRFSHILDDILNILNLPTTRRNEIDLGLGLRKIFGEKILGSAVIKRALASDAACVVINGIRMDEMESVKAIGAKIIYVTAPSELRFKRYQTRHEKPDDGSMNFAQFQNQEKEATEINIPELGNKADFRIDNVGTKEELYQKVDEFIDKI